MDQGTVLSRVLSIARELAKLDESRYRELAVVIYSDGSVEGPFYLSAVGGPVPLTITPFGRVPVAIVHTHPLDKYTPSVQDIATALAAANYLGRDFYMCVATRVSEDRVFVLIFRVKPGTEPDPSTVQNLMRLEWEIARAIAVGDADAVRKLTEVERGYLAQLSRFGVSAVRYVLYI